MAPAFGAGLAICFIPLPVHIPVAAMTAILGRINIPTIMLALIAVNPLTIVPAYLLAYKIGVMVTNTQEHHFKFHMSWDWVQHGLGPMWKPFLIGCGISGVLFGLFGYALLDILWRYSVRKRYRERPAATREQIDSV